MRFDYAYTARSQVSSVTRYSDLSGTTVVGTTSYDYDAAMRETHQQSTNGSGTVLANYTYTFDAADRVTAKEENGTTTTYGYDVTSQLTNDGATTFGYDATGNRTNTGYVTGTGNRMTNDGVWTWTYDNAGNVTKRSKGASSDTWEYTYDNRNQMLTAAFSATDGGTVTTRVTYTYDAWGNTIERGYWNGAATTTERFGYDGWDPAQPAPVANEKFNAWVDLDGSNNLTMRRVYGFRFDEVIARQTSGGTVLSYLTDNQGSVRQLIDNSGTIVGTIAYSAFGNPTVSGTTDRPGYTGHDWDGALGLWRTPIRIYDWWTGRFLEEDTVGFAAGDPNLFRYVHNSPTNATDPSGHWIVALSEATEKEFRSTVQGVIQTAILRAATENPRRVLAPVTIPQARKLFNNTYYIDEVVNLPEQATIASAVRANQESPLAPEHGKDAIHLALAALQQTADPHVALLVQLHQGRTPLNPKEGSVVDWASRKYDVLPLSEKKTDPERGYWEHVIPLNATQASLDAWIQSAAPPQAYPHGPPAHSVGKLTIDRDTAVLTVKIRFLFHSLPPKVCGAVGSGNRHPMQDEKTFKDEFKRVIEHYYNSNPYVLVANGPSGRLRFKPKLKLVETTPGISYDIGVRVAMSNDGKGADTDLGTRMPVMRIHWHSVEWAIGISEEEGLRERHLYWQIPAVHEFGHALGIHHPGVYLDPKPDQNTINQPSKYEADWSSLMGGGMLYREHYFEQWRAKIPGALAMNNIFGPLTETTIDNWTYEREKK